jgi:hypothetical protein
VVVLLRHIPYALCTYAFWNEEALTTYPRQSDSCKTAVEKSLWVKMFRWADRAAWPNAHHADGFICRTRDSGGGGGGGGKATLVVALYLQMKFSQ